MRLSVRSVLEGGRLYAFPMAWATLLAGGVGLYQPLPEVDTSLLLSFNVIPPAAAEPRLAFPASKPDPVMSFVHFDIEPEDTLPSNAVAGGHGRFAAPGNAVRRQIQVKAINPKTADELAGAFRDVSYTLTDVRQGDPVPPIKVERVPDELVKRVDIVPPSMAIAQSGIESGWGTSFAARNGNALFGQIQASGNHAVSVPWKPGSGMPQPFTNVGEAAEAYVSNLNTHPAYAAFRTEREI